MRNLVLTEVLTGPCTCTCKSTGLAAFIPQLLGTPARLEAGRVKTPYPIYLLCLSQPCDRASPVDPTPQDGPRLGRRLYTAAPGS